MKKVIILTVSVLMPFFTQAQIQAFNTLESIDINNISAGQLVHGDMWWNPNNFASTCEYPKGSGKYVASNSSLWMGGFDGQGNLHVSAQTYRQNGNDFWPGPIDTTSNPTTLYSNESKWARIWKINKTTIDSFKSLNIHTLANTPATILQWPAIGNPYASGNGGITLNITTSMAPFVDANGDGMYNALNGDYPLIKGDQMLWWIVNDAGSTHNETNATPFRIEIKGSAYAYKRGGLSDNMVFYEYAITNRSSNTYDSMRVGISSDLELGDAFDDFLGFDSSTRMAIDYNGDIIDGSGQASTYGSNIPMVGVTLVELPGDVGNNYVPAGSFMNFYNNVFGTNGSPVGGVQFNNLLNSTNNVGTHLPNGKSYVFGLSTECDSSYIPWDRRMVVASNNIHLPPNATVKMGMALVVAPNAGGCPNMNFTDLLATADSAWIIYHHPPVGLGVSQSVVRQSLHVYPNPSDNVLYVEPGSTHIDGTIKVYDAVGRTMPVEVKKTASRFEIITLPLAAGMYTITYNTGSGVAAAVFIKK